jgi:hypothetical protein
MATIDTISVPQNNLLTSDHAFMDWLRNLVTTLNAVIAAGGGGGITQLTGDGTAGPGAGSQALALATVLGSPGSVTAANITVNAKGLVTAVADGTAAILAAALAAAPVASVTAGAGLVNSGTSVNPVVDAVASDATLVVSADSMKVGVISSVNVDSTIATSVALAADVANVNTVDQRLTDLERRYRLLLQRHIMLFADVPPGLESESQIALGIN